MLKYVERITTPAVHEKPRWKRIITDSLLAIGGVALITAVIIFAHLYPRVSAVSLFYLLVILAITGTRGLFAASLASLLSFLALDFFFLPPSYTLIVDKLEDLLTLVVFLTISVTTSQLAATLRRRAEQASSREHELRRLYEQAQELASLQERQRLARELHDSVSQALYGISLGAHTAQEALENDPEQARASLAYVISLTEAGLAEMRALIFELRPESLENEGLVAALIKQVAVLRTRYQLTVDASLDEEPAISLELKHTLYRIAQEALHNIVKHARATTVTLRLSQQEHELRLQIRDDGKGFDPANPFPGHFGVRSMQERAIKTGGTLTIKSAPQQGTDIEVRLPMTP
ncbi:MAG: sensor histidine kinase [Ktedonobacteraceae bacterium]|nr:sensor histidine kinase [Ktedonobacteraceae bacterium]MBO0793275.1 sensor histidine kinase [Ktedonobacteraceae bacterium]